MSVTDVDLMLKQVEGLLALAGDLPAEAERAQEVAQHRRGAQFPQEGIDRRSRTTAEAVGEKEESQSNGRFPAKEQSAAAKQLEPLLGQATPYQQTDDTSARVAGAFWHTHILCNPFYAAYFTRPRKDRLTVLEALGEVECGKTAIDLLLQGWFGNGNRQVAAAIEQAAALVYYRHQTCVPVIETIVCDDAGQFKLLTEKLALCLDSRRSALRETFTRRSSCKPRSCMGSAPTSTFVIGSAIVSNSPPSPPRSQKRRKQPHQQPASG